MEWDGWFHGRYTNRQTMMTPRSLQMVLRHVVAQNRLLDGVKHELDVGGVGGTCEVWVHVGLFRRKHVHIEQFHLLKAVRVA